MGANASFWTLEVFSERSVVPIFLLEAGKKKYGELFAKWFRQSGEKIENIDRVLNELLEFAKKQGWEKEEEIVEDDSYMARYKTRWGDGLSGRVHIEKCSEHCYVRVYDYDDFLVYTFAFKRKMG